MTDTEEPPHVRASKRMRDDLMAASTQDLPTVLQRVIQDLASMDLQRLRDVETSCTRVATCRDGIGDLAATFAKGEHQLDDVGERAYAAVIASIAYRRGSNPVASRKVLEVLKEPGAPWAEVEALRYHLVAITYLRGPANGLQEGMRLSKIANALCPDSPGLLHALAELHLEMAIWDAITDERREELLREAERLVNRAISTQLPGESWAYFHFTRARILLRRAKSVDQYADAMRELDYAIAEEARQSVDSVERRNRYQYEKTLAEMRWAVERTIAGTSEMVEAEIQKQARRNQVQVIAAVGFLTSLIALLQFAAALFVAANQSAAIDQDSPWSRILREWSIPVPWFYLLVSVVVMAVILFGAVGIAVHYLNKQNRHDFAKQS